MTKLKATYNLAGILISIFIVELVLWGAFASVYFIIADAIPGLKWERPEYGWLLLVGPVMCLVFALAIISKNMRMSKFADEGLIQYLIPDISSVNITIKYALWRLMAWFFIVALINPQLGAKMSEAKIRGIEIMIAVDVSNSMKAEDLTPNRLTRATRSIEKLLENLHGDRVGIVVFAGQAFVQLPITNDYAAGKLFLSAIDTDIVPVQGTAIGSATELAIESFDFESPAQKVIIILTDGENHEDDAILAATDAAEKGVKVYTIGMGSVKGAPIPEYNGKRKTGFKKDNEGNIVVSKLDEDMLVEIADAGNGSYIRASNAEVGLQSLLEELNEINKTEMGSVSFAEYEDRYQIFLALGLFCLLLEFLLRSRKGKLSKQINLFDS